jgi:hypothetical protein
VAPSPGDNYSSPLLPTGHPQNLEKDCGPPGIASAVPYTITGVGGRPASCNADFVGEVSFLIDIEGEPCQIDGVGSQDGVGVRFYQKDPDHDGRDVRVWRICRVPGAGFVAEHAAAI